MKVARTLVSLLGLVSTLLAGPRGTLQFDDGNQITGELLEGSVTEWVVKSDRFGEVRTSRQEAVFLPDASPESKVLPAMPQQAMPVVHNQNPSAPDKAAASNQRWWRPRSLRGNLYGIISDDNGDRKEEGGVEIRGIWAPLGHDEFRLDGRWINKVKNDKQGDHRTTLDAYWRVDVSERWFTYLGGSLEWDDIKILDVEPRYLLQHYQGGFGYNLVKTSQIQSRVAATWNFFRFESDSIGVRLEADTPSMLIENEFILPWGMKLHQIGQIYFWPDSTEELGVDNEIELTKALGSYWHIGTRHEWRKNAADIAEFPFSKWRLFMGLSY